MAESSQSIHPLLKRVTASRETLSPDEAAALMRGILAGEASDAELTALLTALNARCETAFEIAGFTSALREAANRSH